MSGIRLRLLIGSAVNVAALGGVLAAALFGIHAVASASPELQAAAVGTAERQLFVALALGEEASIGICWWSTSRVAAPMRKIVDLIKRAAMGDLTGRSPRTSNAEFGELGREYNTMVEALSDDLTMLAAEVTGLAGAAEELSVSSAAIMSSAEEASAEATVVAAAAEQVSANVQTVATATEQMSASIREIATNTSNASSIAARAVIAARTANETITQLGTSSAEISMVIKVINSIASQTNLLARFTLAADDRAGEVTVAGQITNAIGAHGAWKKRLATAIGAGSHHENIAAVAQSDQCGFGKWLRDTVPTARDAEHHARALVLHGDFHGEAAKVLREVDQVRLDEARRSTAPGGDFAEASRVLTAAMIKWRKIASGVDV